MQEQDYGKGNSAYGIRRFRAEGPSPLAPISPKRGTAYPIDARGPGKAGSGSGARAGQPSTPENRACPPKIGVWGKYAPSQPGPRQTSSGEPARCSGVRRRSDGAPQARRGPSGAAGPLRRSGAPQARRCPSTATGRLRSDGAPQPQRGASEATGPLSRDGAPQAQRFPSEATGPLSRNGAPQARR